MFLIPQAAYSQESLIYHDGETELEGYLVVPSDHMHPMPGILIVHQWMGLSDHEKEIANRLAKEGYVAFAVDIYGKDDRPTDRSEAGTYAMKYKGDTDLYRQRLNAAFKTLGERPEVDPNSIAVIGYCFGGTGALELARSGADIKAAVSLHGGLSTPDPEDARQIKGTVLILHGADDQAVSDDELMAFVEEMRNADVDWYLTIFGNSVHGFTHRHDSDRYNKLADQRSWNAMLDLFKKVF
jgi:dienelactone hydrolase